jgi:hypothetical protein
MTKAVKPLLQLARDSGACVLLIHHARKSEGQYGDEIRGSGALFALVDVAIVMKRHEYKLSSFFRRTKPLRKLHRVGPELRDTACGAQ